VANIPPQAEGTSAAGIYSARYHQCPFRLRWSVRSLDRYRGEERKKEDRLRLETVKEAEKKAANLLETVNPRTDEVRTHSGIHRQAAVVATLMDLDEDALIRILTEPKNALVKQYQKLLSFDNVKLKFTEGRLLQCKKAVDRKAGQGLRSILEDVMLDIMYEIPSKKEVAECIVNEEAIQKRKSARCLP